MSGNRGDSSLSMLKNQYGQYLLKVIDEMKEEVNSGTLVHD
jgi:glucose-1-phosphate thymidylyltransferase